MGMREEFEMWLKDSPLGWDQNNAAIDLAYGAWCASRAALVIDVPATACADPEAIDFREEVIETIHAAGVRTK